LIGISLPEGVFSPGKPIDFTVGAADPNGAPAPSEKLKYSFFRVVEQRVTYQKDGRTDTRLQEELLPRGEGTLMLFSGRASGKIVPTEAGRYLLRAEDISGDPVHRSIFTCTETKRPVPRRGLKRSRS
jgi:hypothetical protein